VFAALLTPVLALLHSRVFGLSLLAFYAVSTLYHLSRGERRRWLFQRLDHAAIFLLIAGTYTPFLLTNLRGPWG
jgi:hemolysin III